MPNAGDLLALRSIASPPLLKLPAQSFGVVKLQAARSALLSTMAVGK